MYYSKGNGGRPQEYVCTIPYCHDPTTLKWKWPTLKRTQKYSQEMNRVFLNSFLLPSKNLICIHSDTSETRSNQKINGDELSVSFVKNYVCVNPWQLAICWNPVLHKEMDHDFCSSTNSNQVCCRGVISRCCGSAPGTCWHRNRQDSTIPWAGHTKPGGKTDKSRKRINRREDAKTEIYLALCFFFSSLESYSESVLQ